MTEELIAFIRQMLLTLMSVFLAFKLGRFKERQKNEKKQMEEAAMAKQLRDSLSCPDTVQRLHDKYKR